jgi:hypothetical protein
VTGNIKDFPQKFETAKILTPRQFLTQMQMEKK